ncbi:MAG: hypothetical protein IPP57_16545 [Candidatus Obscuribacter sp.]|jgi:hypothetical protein|nr:hypothetical protein [Candidatus Obscuribacter sp.]MBK9205338.1 hypothetical protein [Candidatus Obscuribacter sp.]MBK9622666.1 hypothetical protein [Candidatus Obscuribacter sp.]MBK9772403.1 hypothetical protein [Candidatus Obscuribacter sp.]
MPLIEPPDPNWNEPKIVHQLLVQKQSPAYKQILASKHEVIGPGPSNANSSLSVHFTSVRLTKLDSQKYDYLPFTFMQLPQPGWWTRRRTLPGHIDRYELRLSPNQDADTILTVQSEGVPFVDEYPISKILKEPPHALSSQEKHALKIREVESEKNYTALLQGKQVLCSESTADGKMEYHLLFNHNPDSSSPFIPAQITFEAKPAQYKRYIQQIKACLQTINWNDKVTIVP